MLFQLSITIIASMLFVIATQSTSKYEGVSWNEQKKRWQVEFNLNGKKSKYYFENELDAARTRNRANRGHKKMRIPPQNSEISVIPNQQHSLRLGYGSSLYNCVCWNKKHNKWYAQLRLNGKLKYYGGFSNEFDAAKRVNQICEKLGIPQKNYGIGTIPNQQCQVRRKGSQYEGIYWHKKSKKWYVQFKLTKGKSKYYGGIFNEELDAAQRVNQICEEHRIPQKNPGIKTIPNQYHVTHDKEKRSQYNGIFWNKKTEKWYVYITLKKGKQKYFGIFDDELNAAKRVNQICQEHGIPFKNPGIGAIPNKQWRPKEKTSQYKGVHWNKLKRKWYVQVRQKNGSIRYGGNFYDELDAAKRVNQLCEELGNTAKNPEISGLPNQQLLQKKEKPSHYKGVFWNKKIGKWYTLIPSKKGKQKFGGSFTNELDAAKSANQLCQEFEIPIPNHGIKTNLENFKTLIDYDAIQAEFQALINILDENNDPTTLAIKENLIAVINYGEQTIMKEINLQTENGESALSIAAKHDFSNAVQFLISKGAEKEHFTNEHHTPLSLAVSQNHLKVVQVLLEDWISPNSHEKPYLHLSPLFNVKSREIAQLLIDNDAVTNGIYNDKNQSPLTVACQNGYLDVVEFFLDDGLDINHLDSDNKTPLFYALTNKHYDVVNFLISQGAKKVLLTN